MVDIFPKDFEKKSPSYKNSNSEQTSKIILPPPAKKIIDTLRKIKKLEHELEYMYITTKVIHRRTWRSSKS